MSHFWLDNLHRAGRGTLTYAMPHLQWAAGALEPHCGAMMEDNPPSAGKTLAVHLVFHFAQKDRWLEGWVCISSWALANGLAALSGTWKDHDWKIDDKEVWGAGIWIDFSEWE